VKLSTNNWLDCLIIMDDIFSLVQLPILQFDDDSYTQKVSLSIVWILTIALIPFKTTHSVFQEYRKVQNEQLNYRL
jgi:hypothetical protein